MWSFVRGAELGGTHCRPVPRLEPITAMGPAGGREAELEPAPWGMCDMKGLVVATKGRARRQPLVCERQITVVEGAK